MRKEKYIRIAISIACSNIGVGFISYAGYKMGWWDNQTFWRMMFGDGLTFLVASVVNMEIVVDAWDA